MELLLSEEELRRYSRHVALPGFGVDGQRKLLSSSALVVGLGQQGLAASLYLAAAGVGRLGLVEPEDGEGPRFVQYAGGVRPPAAGEVRRRLQELNPAVRVDQYLGAVMSDLVSRYDVVVACVGTAKLRTELNRLCLERRRPLVSAAVRGWEGRALTVLPGEGPCWCCVFPDDADAAVTEGLGLLVAGALGMVQAAEAIKVLLGLGDPLSGRYLSVDGMTGRLRQVKCRTDPGCPCCSGARGE